MLGGLKFLLVLNQNFPKSDNIHLQEDPYNGGKVGEHIEQKGEAYNF